MRLPTVTYVLFCFLAVSSTVGPRLKPLHLQLNSSIISTGKSTSFAFRTRDDDGTLLLIGSLTHDYVNVSLNGGFVNVITYIGNGMFFTLISLRTQTNVIRCCYVI